MANTVLRPRLGRQRYDVRIAERRGRPAAAVSAPPVFARTAFAIAWVCLGVAGLSAVAAAAIFLPLPHGRSVFAPVSLRSTMAPTLPATANVDVDVVTNWREEWARLVARTGVGLGAAKATAWIPEGGLSTLLARRFPSAGNVRLPGEEVAVRVASLPMPMPRPEGIPRQDIARQVVARQDIARQDMARQDTARQTVVRTVPVVSEPRLASLPPRPKSEGIFEKLFGDPDRAAKAVLAANPKTVLYDIVKRVAYMPDGEKLEAHSGFGQFMDDPDSIHRKDVGVTPPNVYTVRFREKLFHGVRALRMTPVGGAEMHGRDGILAHSYLLGEAGASNGCISLRDYDKFLQAFEAGKFDRIIVLRNVDEPGPALLASTQGDGA